VHNFRILERKSRTETVNIAINGNLSTEIIDMRDYSMLVVHMSAAWTAASIGFKVASEYSGTYAALYDDNGNLVQIDSPTAALVYSAPAEVAACRFVKLWSQNGTGTNAAQAAARALVVDKKS
jgi:hypothetical protein